MIDDFILYGNCFATVEFTSEYNQVEEEYIPGYIGPKVRRISPYDIVFDPTASNFEDSPKIIRTLTSLGELKSMAEGGDPKVVEVFQKVLSNRGTVGTEATGSGVSFEKSDGFVADLSHILKASKVGAKVNLKDMPINNWIKKTGQEDLALYGGDDYQTILTSSKNKRAKIEKLIQKNNLSLSRVGTITKDKKLCVNDNGIEIKLKKGFAHFEKR